MKIGSSFKPQPLCDILNGIKTIEIVKNGKFANIVKKEIAKNGECRIECTCDESKDKLFHCRLHIVHDLDGTGMHNQHEAYDKYGVAKNLDVFQDNIVEYVNTQLDRSVSVPNGEFDIFDYVEEFEWEDDELNGKTVCEIVINKVEEIECVSVGDSDYGSLFADTEYQTETLSEKELIRKSCLSGDEIFEYLDEDFDKIGYALHIKSVILKEA